LAAATAFAMAGASVTIAAPDREDQAAREIINLGGKALGVYCDVTNYVSVEEAVKKCADTFGGIDLVYANAGVVLQREHVENSDVGKWKQTVAINLFGFYHTARAVIPYLKARGGGRIITTGSGRGRRGAENISDYACSKAAGWMLVRELAIELLPDNILVNEFIPGPVMTDLNRGWGDKMDPVFSHEQEVVKTPEDCIPMLMYIATQPLTLGASGQTFSINRREI
jgi:NAD(P)-dependent dehydrogenase (short-subunit alcohol dehydrogenase family)